MTRAALVGCGDVSAVHFEALSHLDDVELVGICDIDPSVLDAMSKRLGVPGFTSVAELLAATKPEVLHITTPHDFHIDYALEALAAGVSVLLEKPIGNEISLAQRLVDFAADLDKVAATSGSVPPKIGVCYQNRYNVSSVELKRLLSSGDLGKVNGAYSTVAWTRTSEYYTGKPWRGQHSRSGGGLLMNQAIHTLDLIQWLMGEVVEVAGSVSTDKYAAVSDCEDTAHALFRHENSAATSFYGTLTLSSNRPIEIELDCENAYVRLCDGLEIRWNDGRVERFEERAASTSGRSYWGVSHELLITDFYANLDNPEPFWISPAEAMKSLKMAKKTYDSSIQKSNIEK
jgi:UDP-N-acetyl-2-amino-2-deoxyglucuronate dehydrogenase